MEISKKRLRKRQKKALALQSIRAGDIFSDRAKYHNMKTRRSKHFIIEKASAFPIHTGGLSCGDAASLI